MAAVLDAADLVLIMAILVLMGLLIATKYTFVYLATILDVGIGPYHPFHHIATAIENTIIGGLNDGIDALGTAVHDLWAGLTWSIGMMIHAIDTLASDIHRALNYLWTTSIHAVIRLYTSPIWDELKVVDNYAKTIAGDLTNDVKRLETDITRSVGAVKETVENDLSDAFRNAEHSIATGLDSLRKDLTAEIHRAETAAESVGAEAVGKLRAAENAAIETLGRAEGSTAQELNNFIGKVPLTDIIAVIGAVPILRALVNTIAQESGLEKAECRAKVKSICTTDPAVWEGLIAGLLAYEGPKTLRGLIDLGGQTVQEVMPLVIEFASAT